MLRLRPLLAAVACALALAAAAAPAAQACVCARWTPTQALAWADVALVGTVTSQRAVDPEATPVGTFVSTIRVERTYKGSLPAEIEVTTPGRTSCSFRPAVGSRIALLLDDAQPYDALACNVTTAEALERATRPPPRPLGRGRVALLATGAFGRDTSVAALDRRGRVLAYGAGEGGATLSVCPGSRRFVQAGDELVVRRMRDLSVLSRTRVPGGAADARCLDASGRTVAVALVRYPSRPDGPGVVLVRPGRDRVLTRGTLERPFLGRRRAVVASGSGDDIRVAVVDYATGRSRTVLRPDGPPVGLALDPSESILAAVALGPASPHAGVPAELHVRDLRAGRPRSLVLTSPTMGRVVWLSTSRFALLDALYRPSAPPAPVHDAATLRAVGAVPDGGWSTAVCLGAAVVGVDALGYLVRASPGAAAPTRVALLPTADVRGLAAVPGAPALRGADRRVPRAARAATLNVCSSPTPSRSAA